MHNCHVVKQYNTAMCTSEPRFLVSFSKYNMQQQYLMLDKVVIVNLFDDIGKLIKLSMLIGSSELNFSDPSLWENSICFSKCMDPNRNRARQYSLWVFDGQAKIPRNT